MMHPFAIEVEAAHMRGECQRAAARARAADQVHPARGDRRRSWLPARGGAAATAGAPAGPIARPSLLGRGWVAALLGRPA
jgi:hypothetical protein